MGGDYVGVIIEESLGKKGILEKVMTVKTKVEKVTDRHKTPYLKQWTLHTVEIPEAQADEIAKEVSESLDSVHSDWYADFKNKSWHHLIFFGKIFKVDLSKKGCYREAVNYGLSLGIPDYQLDFHSPV